MSGAGSAFRPYRRIPKNILWVGTYYPPVPYSISSMSVSVIWASKQLKPQCYDVFLEFQLLRVSELEFRLTCIRIPSVWGSPVLNCRLEFHCSAKQFDEENKVIVMRHGTFVAFEQFFLNSSYRQSLSPRDLNKNFELKILVKMIEYDDDLWKDQHLQQEKIFQNLRKHFFNFGPVLKDLCYILKCQKVQGLFSGYQNNFFAELKSNYIKRTAVFVRPIADYFRAKEAGVPGPIADLGEILNYILNNLTTSISNKDLIHLYLEAYATGLNYLADLCRDCILERIEDRDVAVLALQAADRVNDDVFLDKIAGNFNQSVRDNFNTERFIEFLQQQAIQYRFAMYSLKKKLDRRASSAQGASAGAVASCSYKLN